MSPWRAYVRICLTARMWGVSSFSGTPLGIGQSAGYAAETETPGEVAEDTHAYALSSNYNSERFQLGLGYSEVGPNFNPEVGFYQRRGNRRLNVSVSSRFRPDNFLGLQELRPHVRHNTVWNFQTGQHETQLTHIDNILEWEGGHELSTAMNITKVRCVRSVRDLSWRDGPARRVDHAQAQIVAFSNRGAPFSVNLTTNIGGFFGGTRVRLGPSITMRVGETFNAQLQWDRNDIELPGGDFVTNLSSLRISYSFTTRMFLQGLVQYNDRADLWSSNIRFGLLSDANTGLFIVYNDIQELGNATPTGAGRTLTLKYSHLFDLLN